MDVVHAAVPAAISPDAIVEALFEVRFRAPSDVPEAVLGRLLDSELWQGFERIRLLAADVPQPVRDADPSFSFQPSYELRRADGLRLVRIGPSVVSYHILRDYPGWSTFLPEIEQVLEEIHARTRGVNFVRVGFRYINLLSSSRHFVEGIRDTKLEVSLDGAGIVDSLNLNYKRQRGDHGILVRVATPDFVRGVPGDFSLLVDIDVSTQDGVALNGPDHVRDWILRAHDLEKAEFFGLLPQEIIDRLSVS